MKRFLLNISYDGTEYYGWQIQKNNTSVQSVLEKHLSSIFKKETSIVASGRTDSGVHAINQYAHFDSDTKMNVNNIVKALNSLLPHSIYIKDCRLVSNEFHARFSAQKRIYFYKIIRKFSPFSRNYSAYFPEIIFDSKKIKESIKYLIGKHDFKIFAKDTSQLNNSLCNIYSVDWQETPEDYKFFISSNRFLHKMVRRIVGTIVKISNYDLQSDYILNIFETKDRNLVGDTTPAQGLYLYDVIFKNNLNKNID